MLRESVAEIEFHPASDLFPLMPVESVEFGDLVADIREHGLLEPITLYEGKILDGRNRDRACRQAGVEPRFVEWGGDSPIAYVISVNLHRRHLTDDQRAAVAAEALPLLEAEAKERQREHAGTAPGRPANTSGGFTRSVADQRRSRTQAAKQFQVSTHKVRQAKRLRGAAPDLHDQVKTGQLDLVKAEQEMAYRSAVERYPFLVDMPDDGTRREAVDIAASLDSLRDRPDFEERLTIAARAAERKRSGEQAADAERWKREDQIARERDRVWAAVSVLASAQGRIDPADAWAELLAPDAEIGIRTAQIDRALAYLQELRKARLRLEIVSQ